TSTLFEVPHWTLPGVVTVTWFAPKQPPPKAPPERTRPPEPSTVPGQPSLKPQFVNRLLRASALLPKPGQKQLEPTNPVPKPPNPVPKPPNPVPSPCPTIPRRPGRST